MSCDCFAKASSPPSTRSGASASSMAEDSSSISSTGGASSSSASSCEVSSSCGRKRRLYYEASSGGRAKFLHKHKARRIAGSRPVSLLPGRSFSLLHGTIPPETVSNQDNEMPYVAPRPPRPNELEE